MEYFGSIVDRTSLKKYILRQLGGCYDGGNGSHSVELTEEQLEDIIDDTMVEFLNEIYDGYEKVFIQMDIIKGQSKYTLPSDTLQVLKLHQATVTDSVFRQAYINNITDPLYATAGSYSYLDYTILSWQLNQIQEYTTTPINFHFNNRSKVLTIFDTSIITKVLIECYRYMGETEVEFDSLYGHQHIKKMSVARSYQQWYRNLVKYDAPIYDGNVKLNLDAIKEIGDKMYDEASQELKDKWSDCFGAIFKP